MKEMTKKYL